MPGLFVVLEGGEGAGKSTQARRLADSLTAMGHRVVATREPGGTTISEAIRGVLLGPDSAVMVARTEALLMAAARAQHVAEVIRPALARAEIVVSDRYIDSSVAYQGAGRGLGEQAIVDLSAWATEGLLPDLTIVLDIPPGAGLGRARDTNRMEAEPEAFHAAVRASLLARAASEPERYLVLNTTEPVGDVARSILSRVRQALEALIPDGQT